MQLNPCPSTKPILVLAVLAWAWVVHVSGLVLLAGCPFVGLIGRLVWSQLIQCGVWSIGVGMPLRCAATLHAPEQ